MRVRGGGVVGLAVPFSLNNKLPHVCQQEQNNVIKAMAKHSFSLSSAGVFSL